MSYLSFCSVFAEYLYPVIQQKLVTLVGKDFLIIIADDDQDDQEFIREALQDKFKGDITCVTNGGELLTYLKKNPTQADLILLDLNMPFKDGYQTLSELKADPDLQMIPTVVLTSSSRPEDRDRCYQLGCDKFYRKPMSIAEYETLAREVLSHFSVRS